MKTISFIFLLGLFLSGCTDYSLTQLLPSSDVEGKAGNAIKSDPKPVSDKVLSVAGHYIDKVSIASVKEIKKDFSKRESYQECYTKKYDKNQNEASLITGFFNTSKDSHIASVEFCETKYRDKKESRLMHYLVEYEYEGNTFTFTTKKKPDLKDNIEVKVIVVPTKYKGNITN